MSAEFFADESLTSRAQSSDGLVTATVTGLNPTALEIDPELLDANAPHKLESALREAINAARGSQVATVRDQLLEFASARRADEPSLARLHDVLSNPPTESGTRSDPEPETIGSSTDHQLTAVVAGDQVVAIRVARALIDLEMADRLAADVIQATSKAFEAQHTPFLEALDTPNRTDRRAY